MSSQKLATSLFKALDLLTLLSSRGRRLNIYHIVEAMQLPRSSVLRILDSLMHYGLVGRDSERQYFLTTKFKQWRTQDFNDQQVLCFTPMMQRISHEVGELVLLGRLEGRGIRYLHCEEPQRRVRVSPPMNKSYNLEVTAMGKLAMSQRPDLVPEHCAKKLKQEIEEAERSHCAWNIRESEADVITWATWLGEASILTPILVVAWPDSRFTKASQRKALAILKEESEKVGPFEIFQNPKAPFGFPPELD